MQVEISKTTRNIITYNFLLVTLTCATVTGGVIFALRIQGNSYGNNKFDEGEMGKGFRHISKA